MPRTAETASFKFNHTMIRVKDPQASLRPQVRPPPARTSEPVLWRRSASMYIR
ncbi:hypothetical protein OH76DRAFT_1412405 [Lentinus brumalis]|uniref:Uncharacterized protein n=1 Tax=Lentinus brumalis TaxID=2498619 RepID=A0A371CLE9_9APHY|nr:hypothetical protein OH76DRAFT_1412405 [Polyporus brumalis]